MNVIAVSGSPRKNRNTEKMLAEALSGSATQGAQTKLIRLYDLNFKGCKSCLACKRIGAQRKCFVKDDLSPVLEELSNADALIFGSPIYFMELTGVMHSCLERFYFPYVTYSAEQQTFFKRKLPIVLPKSRKNFLASNRKLSVLTTLGNIPTTKNMSTVFFPSSRRNIIARKIFQKNWRPPNNSAYLWCKR